MTNKKVIKVLKVVYWAIKAIDTLMEVYHMLQGL